MANLASFGTKEPWMEPMNAFLVQHREGFKSFIDEVCHCPAPISGAGTSPKPGERIAWPSGVVSAEQHLSYTTPMTIMQRLPPSSREGFPSLPYLIDQARSFADLIHLWLEAVAALSNSNDSAALPGKTHADIINAINTTGPDMREFHHLCEELNMRTQECLNRAERAERPDSPGSFQWEDVINQLQKAHLRGLKPGQDPFEVMTDKRADHSLLPDDANPAIETTLAQLRGESADVVEKVSKPYHHDMISSPAEYAAQNMPLPRSQSEYGQRPSMISMGHSYHGGGLRDHLTSPTASASASMSNVSGISNVVGLDDTPNASATALPSYEKEIRHRERREAARVEIKAQVEAARVRDKEKEKKRTTKLLPPALRKKREKADKDVPSRSANSTPMSEQGWKNNGMI
jgi:hypothetical protein